MGLVESSIVELSEGWMGQVWTAYLISFQLNTEQTKQKSGNVLDATTGV